MLKNDELGQAKNPKMLYQTYLSTPLGYFEISGTDNGVRSIKKVDAHGAEVDEIPECLVDCNNNSKNILSEKENTLRSRSIGEMLQIFTKVFGKNYCESLTVTQLLILQLLKN